MSRRLICLPDEPPACFEPNEQEVNAADVSQIDAIARELNKAKMCFRENENLRMCLAGLAYISDKGRAEGIAVLDSDVMEATREGARLVVYRDEVKKCVVIKWESPDET